MQYRICPHCRANLDPGESCDCQLQEVRESYGERVMITGRQNEERMANRNAAGQKAHPLEVRALRGR